MMILTPMGLLAHGRRLPCTIGRGGIRAHKREGDGATPAGLHRVVGLYYRPDRVACPAQWAVPIGPRDLWSDDPGDGAYNTHVRAPYPHSHERMRRADPLYDIVVVLDWNWPRATAGRGSAIFVHRWRRPGYPTEGCVALAPEALRWLAPRLVRGEGLLVRGV